MAWTARFITQIFTLISHQQQADHQARKFQYWINRLLRQEYTVPLESSYLTSLKTSAKYSLYRATVVHRYKGRASNAPKNKLQHPDSQISLFTTNFVTTTHKFPENICTVTFDKFSKLDFIPTLFPPHTHMQLTNTSTLTTYPSSFVLHSKIILIHKHPYFEA